MKKKTAWVWFPDAAYTQESALRAARKVLSADEWNVIEGPDPGPCHLYFADYDCLPFEQLHPGVYRKDEASTSAIPFPQISCYSIRKALIRKNYLANSLHLARVKRGSSQNEGVRKLFLDVNGEDYSIAPKTWVFEVTSADDLDELLTDELYDMREELERNNERELKDKKWYILKPAMADRGMGIRLLDSVDTLQNIFAEFEEQESEGEESDEEEGEIRTQSNGTSIVTSQLRHFVIQEYLSRPLLIQPPGLDGTHKFHLRAYVLAQGNLNVYLYDDMLALFAPTPYQSPSGNVDLSSHLTNTCLQDGQEGTVHLLRDLVGCPYRTVPSSTGTEDQTVTQAILDKIHQQSASVIAETFQACANADRVNFQPWPYAWEIFGTDLMVELNASQSKVWLLEVNAQPDFARSGPKLQQVIDRLFERSLEITVLGKDSGDKTEWPVGVSKDGMTLCLDMPMNAGGW
jgi:tubulin--tyrosine ligase